MGTLSDKLIKGSFFRILYPLMNVVVSLLMMPFVIRCIGDRYYGLWILATTFVGYFEFLDLGLSGANQRYISQALGRGDHEEVSSTFNTCVGLYLYSCIIALAIAVVLALATPHFVKNPADARIFRLVILMIGTTMAISLPVSAFLGFMQAHILFDVINMFEIIKLVVRTALILWFLGKGHGIIALAIISLGMEVAIMAAQVVFVRIRFPELPIKLSCFRRDKVRTLLSYSVYSFVAKVAEALQFQMDSFVITAFIGLSAVTHYNIGARIARYYLMFILSAIYLILPVFSRYEGLKAYEEIREKFLFVFKLNIMLSIFVGGALLMFGRNFIGRWMGPGYLDAYPVLAVLTIGLIFNTMQVTSKALLFSISKHKMYALTLIAEGVCNLVLSIILARRYGILGVALGTMIPMILTNLIVIPLYTIRVLALPLPKHLAVAFRTSLVSGAVSVGTWLVMRYFMLESYGRIMLLGLIATLVFFTITGFTLLTRKERQYFKIPV